VFAVITLVQSTSMLGDMDGTFSQFPRKTHRLVDWIDKVRIKRNALKRKRRNNLRIDAILTSALVKAETMLKMKQHQLSQRLQHLEAEMCKIWYNVCKDTPKDNLSDHWDEETHECINSLNRFMCLLNEVRSPLQR
jgi:hypothetical protein